MIYSFKALLMMFTRPGPRALMPDSTWALAIPEPLPLSIPEKISACRAIMSGKAAAVTWPECGDVENGLRRYVRVLSARPISEGRRRGVISQKQMMALWDINDQIHDPAVSPTSNTGQTGADEVKE